MSRGAAPGMCLVAALLAPLHLAASEADPSYADRMSAARESLESGDLERAESGFRQAAGLVPESEEALLGLQLVLVRQERWAEAAAVGDRLLELAPGNFYGVSGQAFARYMLGDLEEAERLYRLGLEMDPESGEMLLGLGFTRTRLGDREEGARQCRLAGGVLPDDPRVDECLAMSSAPTVAFGGSLLGTYLRYTDPWEARDLKSLTLSLGLDWPVGFGLWLGANMSQVILRYEVDDFWQVNPVLGVGFEKNGFVSEGSFTWLFASDDGVDGTPVALGGIGYDGEIVGGGLGLSGSFYPEATAVQVDPRIRFHVGDALHLAIGPELIIAHVQGEGDKAGQGPQSSTGGTPDLYWSGELDLRWVPLPFMSVFAWGYCGPRTLAVEAKGLSVWSSGDVYHGGYSLGLGFDIGAHFALTVAFRHDIGAEQGDVEHDFHRLGGTIGLHVRL